MEIVQYKSISLFILCPFFQILKKEIDMVTIRFLKIIKLKIYVSTNGTYSNDYLLLIFFLKITGTCQEMSFTRHFQSYL